MKKFNKFKIISFSLAFFLILVTIITLIIFNKNLDSEVNYEKLALEHLQSILESATSEKENNSEYNSDEFLTSYLEEEGLTVNSDTISIDGYNFAIDRDTLTVSSSLGATSVEVLFDVTDYFTGTTSDGNKIITSTLSFNSNINIDKIIFENLDGTVTTDPVNASTYSKEIQMEMDKDVVITVVTVDGKKTLSKLQERSEGKLDSLINVARYCINQSGYYVVPINGVTYSIHAYVYDDDTTISTSTKFGDENDVATASSYAKNMVLVKAKKNLTIDSPVTTYKDTYGGPKGLFICCNGTLTNNSSISMSSRGAYAQGENVYLWKNEDASYEYVPASGASSGYGPSFSTTNTNDKDSYYSYPFARGGTDGKAGTNRQTGGGGSGAVYVKNMGTTSYTYSGKAYAGDGGSGTSYSGGTGGGGAASASSSYDVRAYSGSSYGGSGGTPAHETYGSQNTYASGGAGNPDGTDTSLVTYGGTGGLLIIYGDSVINNGSFTSTGSTPGYKWSTSCSAGGGGSGGGSINIFYNTSIKQGSTSVYGGAGHSGSTGTSGNKYSGYTYNVKAYGGTGGAGTVSCGSIASGTYVSD